MTSVIVLGCAVAVAVGLWLAIQTVGNNVVVGGREATKVERKPITSGPQSRQATALLVIAVVVALVVFLLSQLLVAAAATGLAVVLIPKVLAAKAERERAIAKMRGAAEFVESIRGSLGAGSGLQAAIVESAERPPEALTKELTAFVANSRMPEVGIEQALRQLAEDAQEPAIDLLVGSLLAALKGAAGDMGQLFERIADHGRDFAETRAVTQTERAKVEFQTKILSLLVVGVALLSVVVSPDLTAAYDATVLGQLRLLVPALIFGFGWWWLNRMNKVENQYRFQLRAAEVIS